MNKRLGLKILIVDDEPDILELIAEEFNHHGHVVSIASSGNEAIEFLKKGKFDFVVSDFKMPNGSGLDILNFVNLMDVKPIFFFGFLISPAIKVTLFQASLLKIEPTIEEAIAPTAAAPINGRTIVLNPPASVPAAIDCICQAFVQLACHTSPLAMMNPNTINPNKESNLVRVKVVCISLPPLIPLVLIYVKNIISNIDTNCAVYTFKPAIVNRIFASVNSSDGKK